MNKKIKTATLILLMFACMVQFNTIKSEAKQLTLEQAIEIALENNTDTKIALMEVRKANAKVDEAFGYALPTVDFSANFMHYLEKPKIPFIDFQSLLSYSTLMTMSQIGVLIPDPDGGEPIPFSYNEPYKEKYSLLSMTLANSYEARLQVSQILFNSAVLKGIGASKIFLNLSQEALSGTVAKTVTNVSKAFYGVLLTQKMLEILRESLINAENNLKNVRAYNQQGIVSEFDMLRAEVQVENLRPMVVQMENGLDDTKNGLKIVMGLQQSEEIDVVGDIIYEKATLASEGELIDKALKKNFDLRTFETKRQVQEEMINIDRAEYWPTLAAFGSYSMSGQSDTWDFMKYNTGIVGLNFSINLFNGLRTSEKVQQSTIAALQTDEQLIQLKEFLVSQLKSKLLNIKKVEAQIDIHEKTINLAQKAYDISNVKYREGTGTQLDIQNAEMALRQAKTNKLQAVYEYISAILDIDQLTGEINSNYFKNVKP
ncbi:MAG: TolC family protein [bacterium]